MACVNCRNRASASKNLPSCIKPTARIAAGKLGCSFMTLMSLGEILRTRLQKIWSTIVLPSSEPTLYSAAILGTPTDEAGISRTLRGSCPAAVPFPGLWKSHLFGAFGEGLGGQSTGMDNRTAIIAKKCQRKINTLRLSPVVDAGDQLFYLFEIAGTRHGFL